MDLHPGPRLHSGTSSLAALRSLAVLFATDAGEVGSGWVGAGQTPTRKEPDPLFSGREFSLGAAVHMDRYAAVVVIVVVDS